MPDEQEHRGLSANEINEIATNVIENLEPLAGLFLFPNYCLGMDL